LHVVHQTKVELSGHWTFVKVTFQIHAADHQAACSYLDFKQQTNLSAEEPGVDGLDNGTETTRKISQLHHLSTLNQLPPGQIHMATGGEIVEDWVMIVDQHARGMRWTHLKPGRVPENRCQCVDNVFAIFNSAIAKQQHFAPIGQALSNSWAPIMFNQDITGLRQGDSSRIDVEIPIVGGIERCHTNGQRESLRGFHKGQIQVQITECNIVAGFNGSFRPASGGQFHAPFIGQGPSRLNHSIGGCCKIR